MDIAILQARLHASEISHVIYPETKGRLTTRHSKLKCQLECSVMSPGLAAIGECWGTARKKEVTLDM